MAILKKNDFCTNSKFVFDFANNFNCVTFSTGEKKPHSPPRCSGFFHVKQTLKALVQRKLDTCYCTDVLSHCNTLDVANVKTYSIFRTFLSKVTS